MKLLLPWPHDTENHDVFETTFWECTHQREVFELMGKMRGECETMFRLIYGSGLTHRECRCLRIKDVSFLHESFPRIRAVERFGGIMFMRVLLPVQ